MGVTLPTLRTSGNTPSAIAMFMYFASIGQKTWADFLTTLIGISLDFFEFGYCNTVS